MQDERAEVNTSETNTETDTHKSKEAKRAERGRMREYTQLKQKRSSSSSETYLIKLATHLKSFSEIFHFVDTQSNVNLFL